MIDLVTVVHNAAYANSARVLEHEVAQVSHPDQYEFTVVDNTKENVGFARACNWGARQGTGEIVGFINPDIRVQGPFLAQVEDALQNAHVVGCSFGGKEDFEKKHWLISTWVCGAAFFVHRRWWDLLNGFDERFVWSHEETDFILRTELLNGKVLDVDLEINHIELPQVATDTAYKQFHYEMARKEYNRKWPGAGA